MAPIEALQTPGVQESNESELAARYAPNQPYFRGVTDSAFHNQSLKYAGVDNMRFAPLRPPPPQEFLPGQLACPDFFRSIGEAHFETTFDGVSWAYSMRRQAQRVLPYLYLGPVGAARDEEFLRREGITMLLGIRPKHPSFSVIVNADRAAQSLGIRAEYIEVDRCQELTTMMPGILRGMNDHVCRCSQHSTQSDPALKKVLVFCETGNEKSFLLVSGYIMAMLNLDMTTTVYNVQSRRLCVNFDIAQAETLNTWESLLQAHRDVAKAQHQTNTQSLQLPSHPLRAKKRSLADMSEFDPNLSPADQEMAVDYGHAQERLAPFTDRHPV
jgi:hypothetical protein